MELRENWWRLLHEWSLFFKNVEEIRISFSAIPNVLFHKQLSRNGVNLPRQMGQNLPKFSKNGKFRLWQFSRNFSCPATRRCEKNVKLGLFALFSGVASGKPHKQREVPDATVTPNDD
jgi:hypothetical protein